MDSSTAVVIIVALFAVIAIAAFAVFRRRGKVSIKAPFGTGLELEASNEPTPSPPGVRVKDAKSRAGGLVAEDSTGRGAEVEGVEVQDDILVSSSPPQTSDPKENPPA
jgi:hypothetical protein